MSRSLNKDYFRSAMFGCEDALVSTTGVVVGISAGTTDRSFILLAAMVTIAVEALSMGAGEYLSEKSVLELSKGRGKERSRPMKSGFLMFFSYLFAGLIPVIPIVMLSFPLSAAAGTGCALIGLYILGFIKGKIVGRKPGRSAFEVLFVGGVATIAGLIVGILLKI